MPLTTKLIRDDKPVAVPWSIWHMNCLDVALAEELTPDRNTFNVSDHVFKYRYVFEDPDTLQRFVLRPGDRFTAWR